MKGFFKKILGGNNLEPLIKKINSLEPEIEKLSDEDLKKRSEELKKTAQGSAGLDEILPEAFALAREATKRALGQRHFDVQLMGGIVLHQGKIAEMLTGEGKTLAATAPAYLNTLTGKGVHIITVNDYLARRDTVWMGQIYFLLGLSVGCLTHEQAFLYDPKYLKTIDSRQLTINQNQKSQMLDVKSQMSDNELDQERDVSGGFKVVQDFLRPVSRKEAYLADITYGTNHEFGFDYLRDNLAYDLNQQVQRGHHYAIIDEVDSILIDEARTPLIISAPDAESSEFYRIFSRVVGNLDKDEDYFVDEKLKSVSINDEGINKVEKILRIKDLYSPQNLRLVHYLEESLKAKALFHRDKNYVVKNGEIVIVDEFTGRLMYGRRYSGGLHQAIEAKERVAVKQESRTFAQITIQNYFRLYKKISGMTGTAQTSAEEFHKVYNLEVVSVPPNKPMVRQDSPDLIYKNSEAKYRAVVEEIKKRRSKGQPLLIGTASIEHNELLSKLLKQVGVPHEVLNAKNHEREGAIIAQAGKSGAVTVATNMAGRGVDIVLGGYPPSKFKIQNSKFKVNENDSDFNFSEEYKKWETEQNKIKELGGLFVLGTERHEARRIDNQLRGRSGRQGDPGSSQFFLSLEDDLLRIFGGEKIKSLMESFNLPEDQPIESRLVSKVVNEAQKKVEGFNFDARKHLLEYDDVLNKQRTAIYKKRQEILALTQNNVDLTQTNAENRFLEKIKSVDKYHYSLLISHLLGVLDMLWMNHLENMEALRESVRLRAYGQHDPLVEYRRESNVLFKEMLANFDKWLEENIEKFKQESGIMNQESQKATIHNSKFIIQGKIGRNEPCPCGSGKKYKRCHGL